MRGNRFKGFSLTELLAVMVVMSILGTIGVVSYTRFVDTVKAKADTVLLSIVQLEGRRLVTDGIFPEDVTTRLPTIGNYSYVSRSVPASVNQVSVFRATNTVMVYATSGANGCAVVVDRLVGQSAWFIDEFSSSLCSAEYAAGVALTTPPSGSSTAPTQVSFNA